MAYRLSLSMELLRINDMFHISMLRKCLSNRSHMLQDPKVKLRSDFTYEKQHMQIIEHKKQTLHSRSIPLIKVFWRNYKVEEVTWK